MKIGGRPAVVVDVVKTPTYATGVGLVLHGVRRMAAGHVIKAREQDRGGMWKRMRGWFGEVF